MDPSGADSLLALGLRTCSLGEHTGNHGPCRCAHYCAGGFGAWSSHETYKVLNYEVIELPPEILQTYGAGTYRVEIWLLNYGETEATPGFRIGLAWEQPWIES